MTKIFHKFVKEIKKIAEIRNFALPEKAANWDPRIFITRPLPLPNNMQSYPPKFKANRRRFIKLITKSEKREGFTSINFDEFSCENKNKYFHPDGNISQEGYDYMWRAISDSIQASDKEIEKLLRKIKAKQLASNEDKQKSTPERQVSIDGIWDLETQPKAHDHSSSPPVRRSLQSDFNKIKRRESDTGKTAPSGRSRSPSHTISQTSKPPYHHKPRRGRGRGYGYAPPAPFFPFNPFYPGIPFKPFPGGKHGNYGPF